MKLNEDDYIRTKYGIIDKVIIEYNGECNSPNCNCKHVSCVHNYYDEDIIIKSSPNIIDLIEVGDYIGGVRVEEVLKKDSLRFIYLENGFDDVDNKYVLENGVLTKEQFEQMEYRVEE